MIRRCCRISIHRKLEKDEFNGNKDLYNPYSDRKLEIHKVDNINSSLRIDIDITSEDLTFIK